MYVYIKSTYMTDRQGYAYRIEKALTRRISNVICQSFKENFGKNGKQNLTKKLVDHVSNKFSGPLFEETSKAYYDLLNAKNYEDDLDRVMDNEILQHKSKIQSLKEKINKKRKLEQEKKEKQLQAANRSIYQRFNLFGKKQGGGKRSRTHKNLSNTHTSRRYPPNLEITPHPPLLTSVALPGSK